MKISMLATLPLVMACNVAFSEQDNTGFFLGGTVGTLSSREQSPDYDFDGSGNVGGLLMGYHINRNFGIDGSVLVGVHNYFVTQSVSVAPKGTLFINEKLSVYGKIGLAAMLLANEDNNEDEEGFWDNESGYGVSLGAGISFSLTGKTYLRASYEHIQINLEDADNRAKDADFDINYLMFGAYFQF